MTNWFKNNEPRSIEKPSIRLAQNAIRYFCDDGELKPNGIVSNLAHISFVASICPESVFVKNNLDCHSKRRMMAIEVESLFLAGMIKYIRSVFDKIGYSGKINVEYSYHNVQDYNFISNNSLNPGSMRTRTIQTSDFTIKRKISLPSLNEQSLITSILQEITTKCARPEEQVYFNNYVRTAIDSVMEIENL